ncbi:MAG: arylsulfatase [Planctomycetota bacterium]
MNSLVLNSLRTRTRFAWMLLPALVLLLAGSVSAKDPSLGTQPNIVLIMVDDMGWSDLGCYGSEIETPHIDSLAADGLLFTDFYNNGKCTTTRASLLTGRYPQRGGRGIELLDDRMRTIAERLLQMGYRTGMSGKWHNGKVKPHRPIDRGFEESFGLWDGCCNFFDPSQPDPAFKGGRVRFFGRNDKRIDDFPDDFYSTDAFTDHAIETIRDAVGSGTPFFHYLAYTAPHYPLHAKPSDIAKYRGRYDAGWDVLRKKRYQRQVDLGLIDPAVWPDPGPNPNNQDFKRDDLVDEAWEMSRMEVYAAMLDCVDQNIGRLLQTLDELKVAENTLIVFLSDNGGCAEVPGGAANTTHRPGPKQWYSHVGPNWAYAQNTPFRRYKTYTHEGGIATPCVMRWPAIISPGQKSRTVGHIIDLLPTFVDLAGGTINQPDAGPERLPVDGISLSPVLRDPKSTLPRQNALFWHWAGHRAVRDGKWKAVWENKKQGWELYDLGDDRTETQNLAAKYPDRVNQYANAWLGWAKQTGVRVR